MIDGGPSPAAVTTATSMFTLDQVVPWGRSFDEYVRMFALNDTDLAGAVLGCGDGPAAFNAEATRRGGRVVSCDPLYRHTRAEIDARIVATCDVVLEQTRRNAGGFVWGRGITSIDELGAVRMRAMRTFLDDYDAGRAAGRYVEASLPALPFGDDAFDLALCSHFLVLYSARFDAAFHVASLRELCRLAAEVRVFPVLALDGTRSPHLDACLAQIRAAGIAATIEAVDYEFQRGGNEMLRLRRSPAA